MGQPRGAPSGPGNGNPGDTPNNPPGDQKVKKEKPPRKVAETKAKDCNSKVADARQLIGKIELNQTLWPGYNTLLIFMGVRESKAIVNVNLGFIHPTVTNYKSVRAISKSPPKLVDL